jgi:hypothetical protein
MSNEYGIVSAHSSSRTVNFLAVQKESPLPIVGRLVYFDVKVGDEVYRSVGTVSNIFTENQQYTTQYESMIARKADTKNNISSDLRKSEVSIQAVFKKAGDGIWQQHGSALPTSPSTGAVVHLLEDDTVEEMLGNADYAAIGFFRGLATTPLPLNIPNFDSNRGAAHSAVLGKSGSGKWTALSTPVSTPSGWTTMGDLKDGDIVFSEEGAPIKVLIAHDPVLDAVCYDVIFSDGSIIKAGAEHLWYVESMTSRKSIAQTKAHKKNGSLVNRSLLPKEMISSLRWVASESNERDTLTLAQMAIILGKQYAKETVWLHGVAAGLKPVDYNSTSLTRAHATPSFSYEREQLTYPKRALLEGVLSRKATIKSLTPSVEAKIASLVRQGSEQERITFREFADVLERPVRSGALRKLVDKMGLEILVELKPTTSKSYTREGFTSKAIEKIPVYNKRELINAVAEHGSRIFEKWQDHKKILGSVKTTQEIKDTLIARDGKWNYSIPLAKAVQYSEKDLLIDPYVFGAWLGDGASWDGTICGIDDEIMEEVVSRGYPLLRTVVNLKKPFVARELQIWYFDNLYPQLKQLGVIKTSKTKSKHSKFIPTDYLQGSIQQRRDLLAGLMDTDGNATKSASVEFANTNPAIADGVLELALSLGYRATMTEGRATLYGVDHGPKWTVRWSTNDDIFKLPRKIESHRKYSVNFNEHKNNQRYIVAVNPIESIPMRCITVDSPTALYLVGKQFIPTHNTQAYALALGGYMKHENHAIMIIDPQGQWSSENGMIMSPQNFAKSLGREVSTIRVSEDIKLPMDIDVLTKMINKVNLWTRFRRMGTEQKDSFSREVAERIANTHNLDVDPRDLLTKIFSSIANSSNTLSRIYVKGERQDGFRNELLGLAGEPMPENEEGEIAILSDDDLEDIEQIWDNILFAFKPLHNLFSSKNLSGNRRQPLGGPTGFLTQVFQVRDANSAPAPYVIFDMSPNTELHAKAGLDRSNADFAMQKLLDDQDVKALILIMVLEEMKKASEIAFSSGGGNLNTQIVFDEAWRYAPEGRATPEIETLASMLEGFALDTRKFGIGWTYILQSPSDLKTGIWRQLTYVYAGYGLVGEDVRRLETLTDDPKQIDLYRQFISPASTGEYPFMVLGPISPLIFTSSPTFFNAFKGTEEFLEHNKTWIDKIALKRSLPKITADFLNKKLTKVVKTKAVDTAPSEYHVGKTYESSTPQSVIVSKSTVLKESIIEVDEDMIEDTPF